ncbi:hypothetical protein [Pyrococcus kukulkanii]|uniref:DUF4129 domain-containing protein n=1 Tax=Pyrococcus kukulkanii TaxID=1609559 RepID=A0A127B7C1_9EURY|nr:hypothetical protein [Pyrococcus kukulkanii]AMM53291.1 hypothetical protein TQ32_01340 [Pyrococcus kukulkanii]
MKKILVSLTIILLLITPTLAQIRQVKFESAPRDDSALYEFFSTVLDISASALKDLNLTQYKKLQLIMNWTREEEEFYRARGVNVTLTRYLPPFIQLSKEIGNIIKGVNDFRKFYELKMYVKAKLSAEFALNNLKDARRTVETIKDMEFIVNNSTKALDTSKVEDALNDIERLLEYYLKITSNKIIKSNATLVVYVSKKNPYIFENVTIYGYSVFPEVTLHIGNHSIQVPGNFSIPYRFTKIGSYKVYLTAKGKKSNVILVNVSKVPCLITISSPSGYPNSTITLNGSLKDALGFPISNATVYVNNSAIKTNAKGDFSVNYTFPYPGTYPVSIFYPGDDIHEKCSKNVTINVLKIPVQIKIEGPSKVRVGMPIEIVGSTSVSGINISIIVDGKEIKDFIALQRFKITLRLSSPGKHEIVAKSSGNSLYAPAESNVLTVSVYVVKYEEIAGMAIVSLLGFLLYLKPWRSKKKRGIVVKEHEIPEIIKRRGKEERKGLRDWYKKTYLRLIGMYGLKRSTTPRELLAKIDDEVRREFKDATEVHEKTVYGMKIPTSLDITKFFRSIARTILTIIIGEKL